MYISRAAACGWRQPWCKTFFVLVSVRTIKRHHHHQPLGKAQEQDLAMLPISLPCRPGILAESQTALKLSFKLGGSTRISPGPGCHDLSYFKSAVISVHHGMVCLVAFVCAALNSATRAVIRCPPVLALAGVGLYSPCRSRGRVRSHAFSSRIWACVLRQMPRLAAWSSP